MEDKMEKTTPTTLLAQLHKFIFKHQHRVLTGIPFFSFFFFLAQFGRFTPILDCLSSPFFTSYFFLFQVN